MYVPSYSDGNCVVLYSDSSIRVYDYEPTNNSVVPYTEYFYNSHYLSRSGTQSFGTYSTIPSCSDNVTTNFYYRCDILDILLISSLIIFWTWFLISKLVKTLLKGGRIY